MGVSVEDSPALYRVDDLRTVPAAVRFLSCEPLIGPLDGLRLDGLAGLSRVVSPGPGTGLWTPAWVTAIRDNCIDAGVPFFFKQWGGRTPKESSRRTSTVAAGTRCPHSPPAEGSTGSQRLQN